MQNIYYSLMIRVVAQTKIVYEQSFNNFYAKEIKKKQFFLTQKAEYRVSRIIIHRFFVHQGRINLP